MVFQGLLSIQQFIEGRRVGLTKQDVITLLSEENPFNFKLSPRAQEDVYAMGNKVSHLYTGCQCNDRTCYIDSLNGPNCYIKMKHIITDIQEYCI